MKKIIFGFLMIFPLVLMAQENENQKILPPPGEALVGDFYGEDVSVNSLENAMTAEDLTKRLEHSDKVENVAVQGVVNGSCTHKGCWITLDNKEDLKFFVKMKDYAFFVPTAIVGKKVIMEGNAENKVTTVEELRHYAEDGGKSQEEIAAITQPEKEIFFMASGIKVIE